MYISPRILGKIDGLKIRILQLGIDKELAEVLKYQVLNDPKSVLEKNTELECLFLDMLCANNFIDSIEKIESFLLQNEELNDNRIALSILAIDEKKREVSQIDKMFCKILNKFNIPTIVIIFNAVQDRLTIDDIGFSQIVEKELGIKGRVIRIRPIGNEDNSGIKELIKTSLRHAKYIERYTIEDTSDIMNILKNLPNHNACCG